MLTKEERRKSAHEREENKERLRREFPGARLGIGRQLWIDLKAGDEDSIEVSKAGRWEEVKTAADWEEIKIYIGQIDLGELARFIHALAVRYNAQVREINRAAGPVQLEPLVLIEVEALEEEGGAAADAGGSGAVPGGRTGSLPPAAVDGGDPR